ncbi:MAG: MnmC family methyltransferase [Bacteroidia bacterium]|nr:MnmC family methyltransferase [Bacteroidia bacterium]MDW8235101.1 MnmC family methyltransferase [Bacteroidia bacterium]
MKFFLQRGRRGWIIAGEKVHYVGGNLEAAWEEAFESYGLNKRRWNRVLLIGMGASLMQIIARQATPPMPFCTILEVSEEMISLQQEHFSLPLMHEVIVGDAAQTLPQLRSSYDGIFVDAFVEEEVPESLLNLEFVERLRTLLSPEGLVFWNVLLPAQAQRIQQLLTAVFPAVRHRYSAPHTIWGSAHKASAFPTPF